MKRDFDLAVIGSGFGGSLLTTVARSLGLSVLLVERGRHPRFAIGESTSPLTNLILEQIEASHYQVFGSRISLPPWRRLATAMKVWFALRTKRK